MAAVVISQLVNNLVVSEKSIGVLMKSLRRLMGCKKQLKAEDGKLTFPPFYASLLLSSSIFPLVTGKIIRMDVCRLNALFRTRARQTCHTDDVK